MKELEKVIEEVMWKEYDITYCKPIAQAVQEHLEKEGWVKPHCEHDWYVDKDDFCRCRKGCGE